MTALFRMSETVLGAAIKIFNSIVNEPFEVQNSIFESELLLSYPIIIIKAPSNAYSYYFAGDWPPMALI